MTFGSLLQQPVGEISRTRVTSNHDTSSMILLLAQWGSIECVIAMQGNTARNAGEERTIKPGITDRLLGLFTLRIPKLLLFGSFWCDPKDAAWFLRPSCH